MALDYASLAANIWNALRSPLAMNPDGSYDDTQPITYSRELFCETWATEYDNDTKNGVVLGAAPGSEDKSLIKNYLFTSPTINTSAAVLEFATVLANYWATAHLEFGDPQVRDEVVSVTNDASTRVSAFQTAIQASITSSKSDPPFEVFFANIEGAAKTIIWTITEIDTEGSTTYTSTIA